MKGMKDMKVLVLVTALMLLGLPLWAGGACCSKGAAVDRQVENLANGVRITITSQDPQMVAKLQSQPKACGGECKDCPMHAEGVTRQVEKVENGVVITATSNNPEQVKALQAHAAAMGAKAKGACCSKGEAKGTGCSKHAPHDHAKS